MCSCIVENALVTQNESDLISMFQYLCYNVRPQIMMASGVPSSSRRMQVPEH